MKGQWAQRAQAILGQSDWGLSTERVDDGALRIVQLGKRGLPEVLDRHSPRHGTPRGLSWGWTAVIGLASSVTAGDHRTVSGATSLQGLPPTLSARTAQGIAPLAVSADRLSHRRQPWSQPTYGHQSARALQARSLEGHAWPQDVIRGDATPVSGEPAVPEGGLGPFGPRQAAPTRPPSTVRLGALAPLGRPLSTAVWAGARADDGLSLPRIERMRSGWNHTGLLVVGAGQMRAWDTRASRARHQDWSLSPWPVTGAPAAAMDAWSTAGVPQRAAGAWDQRGRTQARGHAGLAAAGEELARTGAAPDSSVAGRARGLVGRAPRPAAPQAAGLAKRLHQAAAPLTALPPPRGRGKRHIPHAATLVAAMARVLTEPRGEGLLRVTWAKQVEQTTPYVGRGRGASRREQRVSQHPRSPITPIARQDDPIAARRPRVGWTAFVTQAEPARRSLQEAVVCYRHAYRVERLFNRRKSRGPMAPLLGKRNEQMEGLTSLLTLGVRGWTGTEFGLRRSLETAQASLPGLPPEHTQKRTDKPTAERILKAFADLALTIIKQATGEDMRRRLTPLSGLQEDILQRLGLGAALYGQLAI